ncbi:hypothetical protein OG218_01455 [Kineococcus sp. NBC_00420]
MTVTATASTTTLINRRSELTRPDGTALRVLVVDDESTLSELLSMTLRYEGWEVSTWASLRSSIVVFCR